MRSGNDHDRRRADVGSDDPTRWLDRLIAQTLSNRDVYMASALHPYVDVDGRRALERILFASSKLRRHLASAPYAPPSVLARLARVAEDAKLMARIARHPAAPSELLRVAAEPHPVFKPTLYTFWA
jgi:hypothetical protein